MSVGIQTITNKKWQTTGRHFWVLSFQLPILNPLRHIRGFSVAFLVVGYVVGQVAQEQARLAVAFEGQDVGADAVEEPAVVADDHCAASKILQCLPALLGVDIQLWYVDKFLYQRLFVPLNSLYKSCLSF